MKKLNKLVVAIMAAFLMFPIGSVAAARTDMVDVSNHNGNMYVSDWTGMRDKYGVKSMVTKISEGTFYKDYTAVSIKMVITLLDTRRQLRRNQRRTMQHLWLSRSGYLIMPF